MENAMLDTSWIVDPTGGSNASAGTLALAPRPEDLRGITVGLLDNGKQNAREFLEELGTLLRSRYGVSDVILYRKVNNTAPLAPALLEEMKTCCEVVVTAVGDCGSCSVLAVGDGIAMEREGVPAAVVCTEAFKASSDAVAAVYGAPGYEYALTAHPVAGIAPDQLKQRAALAVEVVARLLIDRAESRGAA